MTNWGIGTFSIGAGAPFAGLVVADQVRRLDAGLTVNGLIEEWESSLKMLQDLADSTEGDWVPLAGLTVHPPLQPRQILQSGANYRKHVIDIVAAEFLRDKDRSHGKTIDEARAFAAEMQDKRATDGEPYIFIGLPSAMCGPYDDVVPPAQGEQHDYELELAVVIGKRARNVPREQAMSHVAGYTICNDLTTRDRLYRPDLKAIGTDWLRAKNAPTFLPTGPWIVPSGQITDPSDLRITLRHNGIVRQDESTADMIFDVPRLIEYASTLAELLPGDLLLTGSPAGNGTHWGVFLQPGDVMECEITRLGTQRNSIVAAS